MARKEHLDQLGKFLRSGSVASLKHDYYITCDRAVLWICYGVFADARSKADSLETTLRRWANRYQEGAVDEYDAGERYQLAFELLKNAVRQNRLHLIAKYRIPDESELVPRTYVPPREHYQIISAADLVESDVEEIEGGQYVLGQHTIELLLVPYAELELVFGSLVRNLVTAADSIPRAAAPSAKMGRKRRWDWDGIYIQLIILANQPDGLPNTQAELERWVEGRFLQQEGAAPDVRAVPDLNESFGIPKSVWK